MCSCVHLVPVTLVAAAGQSEAEAPASGEQWMDGQKLG